MSLTDPLVTKKLNVGASADIQLRDRVHTSKTLITFRGSLVGNVTVTVQVRMGERFNDVTDGTIDLAAKDYIYIPDIPLQRVKVEYDGTDQLDVYITQFPTC